MEAYSEYKDSGLEWLGSLPEAWDVDRFTTSFSFFRGLDIKKRDLEAEGLPVLSYGQIHAKDNPTVTISPRAVRFIPEDKVNGGNLETALLREGDLVFADTSEDVAGCGNFARADASLHIYAGYHTLVARPHPNTAHKYFAYLCSSDMWRQQIRRAVQGVKVFSITQTIFKSVSILRPPVEEQRRVVDFLDAKTTEIDVVVEKLRRQRALLERHKRELIAHTVTKGLDPEAPMKESGLQWIGEIPEAWRIQTLSNMTNENKTKNKDLSESNLLSLSYGTIIRKDINLPFGLLPASFDAYQIVNPGYVVLRMTDLQNDKRSLRSGYVRERGIITGAYIGLIPRAQIDPRFLGWMMRAYDLKKIFYGLGSGVRQSLNYSELRKLPTLLPPLREQEEIADYLDSKTAEIDGLITDLDRQIESLGKYRKQVINDTVTGKVRVSEEAA